MQRIATPSLTYLDGGAVLPGDVAPPPVVSRAPRAVVRRTRTTGSRWIWACYAVMGVVLTCYLASMVVRPDGAHWTWLDGWTVDGTELLASGLCLLKALKSPSQRMVPLILGLSLLTWSLGDTTLTIETIGGASAGRVSAADGFYLGFYPLAYVATVLLMRSQLGRLSRPNWLDGIIVGLGASALCATFVLRNVTQLAGRGTLSSAVNLAYPVGDLLLLALVFGGTALLGRGKRDMWYLLAAGISLNVVGDTFNLFQRSAGSTVFGSDFNAIAWPVSILLMSMAVWLRPSDRNPLAEPRTAGFALPSFGALIGLVLLSLGTQHRLGEAIVALSLATLVTAGVRFGLSARDLRLVTEHRHRQAMTDELTGLGNRRRLAQVLDGFFGDVHDGDATLSKLAFLFVDLNHFKEINDSFGHPAGDELLRQVGPRLGAAVRSTDAVMRLGGDEFGIVLLDADEDEAAAVATRVASSLIEPFRLDEITASVGVSVGIALCPNDATDATGLLWCADVAMYRAKLGHIPFACYDQAIDGGEQQLRMVDELRGAVERGELVLHYQPQLDLRTGRVEAVEALVRWPHPVLGLVPPLKFLPLAEDAGLMGPLTALVLDRALEQCARWRADGRRIVVSVNVSTSNLLADGFPDLVERTLIQHGLPGSALVLEITETGVISDFSTCQDVIAKLKLFGTVVSIDDFGAGVTSLAYLSSLAVKELKLDRTLITALGDLQEGPELEVVRATIDLGHAMGLRVVAEGIEDEATLNLLRSLGCDLAQGYLISRPMPAEELSLRRSDDLATAGAARA